VFRIAPGGALTTLYSFCTLNDCADGSEPSAALVQGTDGNFYGTTYYYGSGAYSRGTIFSITPSGAPTTLHSFCLERRKQLCADGMNPASALVQASDGNFWGTNSGGDVTDGSPCLRAAEGCGTIFYITPTGEFSTYYIFLRRSENLRQRLQPERPHPSQRWHPVWHDHEWVRGIRIWGIFKYLAERELDPALTPDPLTFSEWKVGSTSERKQVTIRNVNTGLANLALTSFAVSGPFAISATTCGATLAAGRACQVSITFSPTATGVSTGTLSVSDNAPGAPQTVNLSGTGD
jgi:uncharacterized repeat protein (TIGR03803 family)